MIRGFVLLACFLAHLPSAVFAVQAKENGQDGQLFISVKDDNGKHIPCRIHLADKNQKPIRVPNEIYWHDHFVCNGTATIKLPAGQFHWTIEKGPEFEKKSGTIRLAQGETKTVSVEIKRIANLKSKSWISGDLHVHRDPNHIRTLMRAEELDFAPVITWWNRPAAKTPPPLKTVFRFDRSRIYTTMAGEDERNGGALLFFGLGRPLDLTVQSKEYPSPMEFVRQARTFNPRVWIDIEKPFWWDVPVWLASQKMNSIGIANNHMCRSQMLANEAWGKPRNTKRLPNPRGNGFWTQEIYYHLLNCGIRLPPSAGSASGVLPNPVGYNRVYVYCEKDINRDNWFEALGKGRAFVTNGPLLIAKANGKLPGASLSIDKVPLSITVDVDLTTLDHVPALEVVYNGKVVHKMKCSKQISQTKTLSFEVDQPGWFLIRAIADVEKTFRFGSTAPWYIESANHKNSVSRNSANFFLDWTKERIEKIRANVNDPVQKTQILKHHVLALEFWNRKVQTATRD